jgi:Uncharacterized conserved protein
MGKPAACIGDIHTCVVTAPVAHIGGPITGPGASSVWIAGRPAALAGDSCICTGAIDRVITGSSGVFIEGKPAVRAGDRCEHGGIIVTGCVTVLIGEMMPADLFQPDITYSKQDQHKEPKPYRKPRPARRRRMIGQAIRDATEMLTQKQQLLRKQDAETMRLFKKWFGRDDEKARGIILRRIRRALRCLKGLTEENFGEILDVELRKADYAYVTPDDKSHRINLGIPFWQAPATGKNSRAGILVHEISHFEDVEGTQDYEYDDFPCLRLALFKPDSALFNADNFERFIET